jgi:hypothetical protein
VKRLDGNKKSKPKLPLPSSMVIENLEKLHLREKSQEFIRPNDSTRGPIKCHLNEE